MFTECESSGVILTWNCLILQVLRTVRLVVGEVCISVSGQGRVCMCVCHDACMYKKVSCMLYTHDPVSLNNSWYT